MSYKLLTKESDLEEGFLPSVLHIEGGLCIPFDPTNTDYQEYLAWVAEGNTAEPADE